MGPAGRRTVVAEVVWDANRTGTALNECGCAMSVGHPAEWTPEHLLTVAASSSLMSTFFELAARDALEVLGYVSTSRLEISDDPALAPSIVVTPCIVVASAADAELARAVLAEAARRAPVHRILTPHVTIEPDLQVLAPPARPGDLPT